MLALLKKQFGPRSPLMGSQGHPLTPRSVTCTLRTAGLEELCYGMRSSGESGNGSTLGLSIKFKD